MQWSAPISHAVICAHQAFYGLYHQACNDLRPPSMQWSAPITHAMIFTHQPCSDLHPSAMQWSAPTKHAWSTPIEHAMICTQQTCNELRPPNMQWSAPTKHTVASAHQAFSGLHPSCSDHAAALRWQLVADAACRGLELAKSRISCPNVICPSPTPSSGGRAPTADNWITRVLSV